MGEQEQFEASIWGQSVKVAAGSILPLLLIVLLGLDAWLLHTHAQITTTATTHAAETVIAEFHSYLDREIIHMRAQHTERGREHDAITRRMNEIVELQNHMFLQVISKKSIQDANQHARIELALVRACRAQDRDFK